MTWGGSEENPGKRPFRLRWPETCQLDDSKERFVVPFIKNAQPSTLNPCLPPRLEPSALVADHKIFHIHAPAPSRPMSAPLPALVESLRELVEGRAVVQLRAELVLDSISREVTMDGTTYPARFLVRAIASNQDFRTLTELPNGDLL
jgi:hypothetical protein